MKTKTPHRLQDYHPPDYLIPSINLIIEIDPQETLIQSKLLFEKNPQSPDPCNALFLNGCNLELKEIKIDGENTDLYRLEEEGLVLLNPKESFTLETRVAVHPKSNTRLEGIYLSGDILCSQCEAEGFRQITYTLDRPDLLSVFTVTLIADKKTYPILLSNGNRDKKKSGIESDGRLREVFVDPFPKPPYLFAVVAGDMDALHDEFLTLSERKVNLSIYSEKGKIDQCRFAMTSLKAAMRWEEEVYDLEYDLEDYKIVAVDSFNLGAMENKGLNIFNSALIFYDQATATDSDREKVAATIAHEYFHNWTGNRVTIRDWFQLTLKEGLTVYRDRCFIADHSSRSVMRIRNTSLLRSLQFPEDNGPLAHSIQPNTYESINNFYTLTVYEKGAEVVRMYETLLGKKKFIHGVRQYLHYFDGQATTINDFFKSMQSLTQQDINQFLRWYHTPGTPEIQVETVYQASKKTLQVRLVQSIPIKPKAEPLLIPLYFSVNVKRGKQIVSCYHGLWVMQEEEEIRFFSDVETFPHFSLNENFSAPVKILRNFTLADWVESLRYERNPFLKWDTLQQSYLYLFTEKMKDPHLDIAVPIKQLVEVMSSTWEPIMSAFSDLNSARYFLKHGIINHPHRGDCSFLAQLLNFPTPQELMDNLSTIDFAAIHSFLKTTRKLFVQENKLLLEKIYFTLHQIHSQPDVESILPEEPLLFSSPSADPKSVAGKRNQVGERELKNTCLKWLAGEGRQDLALIQFHTAQPPNYGFCFNDEFMALQCVLLSPDYKSEQAAKNFYQRWRNNNLVINRWLEAMAKIEDENIFQKLEELQTRPEFNLKEPNKCKSLFRTFVRNNPFLFNHPSGEGYRIIADVVIRLDQINPLTASDLLVYWPPLKKLINPQKSLIHKELKRIQHQSRSKDVLEIIEKCLNA